MLSLNRREIHIMLTSSRRNWAAYPTKRDSQHDQDEDDIGNEVPACGWLPTRGRAVTTAR